MNVRAIEMNRSGWFASIVNINVYFAVMMCFWVFRPAMNAVRIGPMSLPYFAALLAPLLVMATHASPVYLLRRTGMGLLLLLFCAGVWMSSGYQLYYPSVQQHLAVYAIFFLNLVAMDMLAHARGVSKGQWVADAVLIAVAAAGIIEFLFWDQTVWLREALRVDNPMHSSPRTFSIFIHPYIYGGVCLLGGLHMLVRLMRAKERCGRIALMCGTGVLLAGAVLAQGRIIILAALIGGGVLLKHCPSRVKRRVLVGLIGFVILIIGSAVIFRSSLYKEYLKTQQIVKEFQQNENVYHALNWASSGRLRRWDMGLNMLRWDVWRGVGAGRYLDLYQKTLPEPEAVPLNIHSSYLTVLVEGGLLTFIPFALLFGFASVRRRGPNAAVWWAMAAILLVDHFFDKSAPWSIVAAWIVISTGRWSEGGFRDADERKKSAILVPSLEFGGGQRVAANIINGLAQRSDLDVSVVVYRPVVQYQLAPNVVIRPLNERLGITGRTARLVAFFRKWYKLQKELQRSLPDSVLAVMPSMNILAILAGSPGMRLVVSEHNCIRGKAHALMVRLLYKYADAVVAVSEGVAEELRRASPHLKPVVIYNPLELERIDRMSREDTAGLPSGPFVLGVGRLTRQKGFDLLLEAVCRISRSDVKVVLLGEGPEEDALKSLAGELGMADRVLFPGFVDNPFVWMRGSACFVLSSRWEGFGLVLAEALASGASVVSFDCRTGPSEILENGRLGALVPPEDVEGLAREIDSVLQGRTRPEEDAVRRSLQRFDAEKVVGEYAALLTP